MRYEISSVFEKGQAGFCLFIHPFRDISSIMLLYSGPHLDLDIQR